MEVYQAAGEAEAQMIKEMLENNGIHGFLKSNTSLSVHAFAFDSIVKVMVSEADAEEARKLITRIDSDSV